MIAAGARVPDTAALIPLGAVVLIAVTIVVVVVVVTRSHLSHSLSVTGACGANPRSQNQN